MSGQAKLDLLPCRQGLAGSKPRQWGHYCCDGAVGEMVMSGERVGVFLHVKYGHRGRHMYTHTHTGEDTQANVHTHIHTGALSGDATNHQLPTLQMGTLRQREATTHPKAGQKSQGPSSQLTAVAELCSPGPQL